MTPAQCAFVGDHDNDVPAAQVAGRSFALNFKSPTLNRTAAVVVLGRFRNVLDYLPDCTSRIEWLPFVFWPIPGCSSATARNSKAGAGLE